MPPEVPSVEVYIVVKGGWKVGVVRVEVLVFRMVNCARCVDDCAKASIILVVLLLHSPCKEVWQADTPAQIGDHGGIVFLEGDHKSVSTVLAVLIT